MKAGQRGSILIAALWAMIFFGTLVAVFSVRARSQANVVGRLTRASADRADALPGIVYVRELIADPDWVAESVEPVSTKTNAVLWMDDEELFRRVEVAPGARSVSIGYEGEQGFIYGLDAEENRINLNRSSQEVLARVYDAAGLESSSEALGKETVNYRQRKEAILETGSTPSRGTGFGSVEELLDLPGITWQAWERLRGGLTVYGSGLVNLNTAPESTLVLAGLEASLAKRIVEYRRSAYQPGSGSAPPFKDLGDLTQKIGVSPAEETQLQNVSYLWGFDSTTFRFIVAAEGAGVGYECVLDRQGRLLALRETTIRK